MQVLTERRLFQVSDYHQMVAKGILSPDERVELIKGEIIKMSPIRSPHASVVDILSELLIIKLHGKAIVRVQNPFTLDDYSEPEPDILVAKYQAHRYRKQHPTGKDSLLVIEVADSTLQKDRSIKAPIYVAAAIPEYWIVNVVEQQLEVYRNPTSEGYKEQSVFSLNDTVEAMQIDFAVELKRLFH